MEHEDTRLDVYLYYKQLMEHLKGDTSKFFSEELIYPRQFEIHLPANHIKACSCHCIHCAGATFDKTLGTWEMVGLKLLDNLKGAIPFHIYGGAYTEPAMNPYYISFLAMTKKYGNHFGIHTNGIALKCLEDTVGWLTELNRISTDRVDYLSIAIDAGFPWSWAKVKNVKDQNKYNEILNGIRKACDIRDKNGGRGHAIRLCYLVSPHSGTREDFEAIVAFARACGVDSIRFSIPFHPYNVTFDVVHKYKEECETPFDDTYRGLLNGLLSEDKTDIPYVFYTGPEFTDIDKFDFDKCLYYLYQVTIGADGYFYKCSTCATPTASQCRLGKITSDVSEFEKVLLRNANYNWSSQEKCFKHGIRCNRMGLEINRQYYLDTKE
jgi:MoaA/NifB/PqqE/SkfB family radical SAM enzyme